MRALKFVQVKSFKCGGVVEGKNGPGNPQGAVPSRVGNNGMVLDKKKVDGMALIDTLILY